MVKKRSEKRKDQKCDIVTAAQIIVLSVCL